ncbi:urea carboxylase [Asticcacaulis sp. EMRT-3]|uniref:urea carboxylase n=1 Tax=Asticcacaulis sp. EMRT-3 TaxID=3040349 RepID=UPI0024AF88C1|nr:urea carboxylase [Asticcacaulis sp. EMRT-3]MDI7775638.1 urea carboxylase [Asticcacaulis sp. EMRT-3]
MIHTVLIANRGEIAVRIIRTLKKMGVRSIAVYSEPDRNARHVREADLAVALGGEKPAENYLRGEAIIAAAKATGAQAIIPGYGFLSENADFADACEAAGLAFCGPTGDQMRGFGLKHAARALAEAANVPLTPGSGLLKDLDEARAVAARLGYPVMLKSTAGGGGIGLTRCDDEAALDHAFESVRRLGQNFFSDSGVFLERFVERARHVEVQIFGDGKGGVVALGERDCSLQRRNQKVVEETPAPRLPPATRRHLLDCAAALARSVNYRSAGTVEFIYDEAVDQFYFLEVNTRLQVEHAITEAVTGIDLVEWMIRTAQGDAPDLSRDYPASGAAIEVRIYAEDPIRNFAPSPGLLTEVVFPAEARIDTWVEAGTEVSSFYDPMIAKLIVKGDDRADAIARLNAALAATRLGGIATNLDYLRAIAADAEFAAGQVSTARLNSFVYTPKAIEIIEPGTYTTVQDYPGRVGLWDIGVPPSGPMDDRAFRLGNAIVGNDESAAGFEATISGPALKFHADGVIALTGAACDARLDDQPIGFWQPVAVKAGQVLRIGRVSSGCRTYLAVRGGLDVPLSLGSRSTFVLGHFGGHAGRTLRAGDILPVGGLETAEPKALDAGLIPAYGDHWEIGVLYGPHGAPDFFTEASMDAFFAADWTVHYNSNRLGVRLVGPKPEWARSDGGEAGLHPSNIHDCEYAIGSINFTGDMPVILTRDGPSLGGFVCPVTIAHAELWKVGQVKPGDRIRFRRMDFAQALAQEHQQNAEIARLEPVAAPAPLPSALSGPVLHRIEATGTTPLVTYRQAGDKYILLEYGPVVLDLAFRLRIHALMEDLTARPVAGILELSPGVRSLQIHYDSLVIDQPALLAALLAAEARLPPADSMSVPSRIIHLPMAFEDSATLGAVKRYQETVKPTAPWLPSNTEFIRRINGLDTVDQVRDILFSASYMVLGLGDVYLGAPCAVPVDPRHRLLTSKYNPARTYTAEGTVGIGGIYMCIYGMDSPGGYQLVGRSLPIWNQFLKNEAFIDGKPWLLRFFDQVRFYPVSEAELEVLRADFREGRHKIEISDSVFSLAEHKAFLASIADELTGFTARQQVAFAAEVALWGEEDTNGVIEDRPPEAVVDAGHIGVSAAISGNVWKIAVAEGASVKSGDVLAVLEAMKTEFHIYAPSDGVIKNLSCREGRPVDAGAILMTLAPV